MVQRRPKLREEIVQRLVCLELEARGVELRRRNLIRVAAADAGMEVLEVALEIERRRDLVMAIPQHELLEPSRLPSVARRIEAEVRRARRG